jgi:phage-related protein
MALLPFPTTAPNPVFPVAETRTPVISSTKFGDGYEQETGYDLNQDQACKVDLVWDVLTTVEKDIIVNFLQARKGYERFTYQTPGSSAARTWSCPTWAMAITFPDGWQVRATFVRKFDTQ